MALSDVSRLPSDRVPAKLEDRYQSIVSLTDAVSQEHLNGEYAELCRKMAAALCRKRPSPVESGQAASWACGIAYAVGAVNFLFDPTQKPHLTTRELCALFGVSQSNAAAKASLLRKIFGISPLDWEWVLRSKLEDNPLVWMVSVDGVLFDIRTAPHEVQELAVAKGLIPNLPGAGRTRGP